MSLIDKVKSFFKRGGYIMETSHLSTILDHPKVAITSDEYARIEDNLKYYKSEFDDIAYLNSNGDQQKRKFNHLPIGRTSAKKIASLVYNEQAEITCVDENADEFINSMLKNDRFNKNFERYLESGLALGGLALRPYLDGDKIRVAFIQAPVFLPLQSNTQDISSAAILTQTAKSEGKKNIYYTLVEFHEWVTINGETVGSTLDKNVYRITNELYKSNVKGQLGNRAQLSELYPDLEPVIKINDLSRPLFTYFKNPGMNNKDINSPLGLSIFDNAKTTIDFINRTYDEFMWEVRMGQRRVIVPEQLTQMQYQNADGVIKQRRRFDVEQNIYTQMGGLDSNGIVDLTTPIRSQDYIAAISEGLKLFEMQIGVSSGMFTFDGQSVKTATEIVSENSDTYQMRNSIVSLVEQTIKELCVSICELGASYELYSGDIPDLDDISVNLDDGVFTDRHAELDYWMKMVAAGFATQKKAIAKVQNITDEEAEKELAEINGEIPPENDAELALYSNPSKNEVS